MTALLSYLAALLIAAPLCWLFIRYLDRTEPRDDRPRAVPMEGEL